MYMKIPKVIIRNSFYEKSFLRYLVVLYDNLIHTFVAPKVPIHFQPTLQRSQCLKITEKVSFKLVVRQSILIGRKLVKNTKSEIFKCDIFWWFSNTVEMLEKKRTFLLEFWIINLTLFLNWHVPSLIDVECADLISNSALWPPSHCAFQYKKQFFQNFEEPAAWDLRLWHSTNEWQSARTLLICQDLWKISQSSA